MYCLEIWGNNFNNNLQCISTLQKKAIRIVNKNIFKIVNNIFIFTNTNNLFLSSNILKFKDLIIYKNILFMHNVHLKKMVFNAQAEFHYYFLHIIIYTKILFIILNYLI